jgi:hypothetical protein
MTYKNLYVPLDSTYRKTMRSTLVIDFRVAVMSLFHNKQNSISPHNKSLQWKLYFNTISNHLQSDGLIVIDDKKDEKGYYWRNYETDKLNLPVYKGNRGCKPEGYQEVYEAGLQFIAENNIDYFAQPSLEADDWAGLIYRLKQEIVDPIEIIIVSIDGDLQQLVDTNSNVLIYSPGWWKQESYLKDELEIIRDYQLKGINLKSTYDLVDYKVAKGDRGDNLQANSPHFLIDLRVQPPVDFDSTQVENLKVALVKPKFSQSKKVALEAGLAISSNNFQVYCQNNVTVD